VANEENDGMADESAHNQAGDTHSEGADRSGRSDRTVITGGLIVTDYGRFRADLVIDGERIGAITSDASDLAAEHHIDATGLWVLPGGIDAHTHFREPEIDTKEGFTTGGAGAAAGGITTVIEMPQAGPTTTSAALFRAKRDRIGQSAIVDTALWGGVIPGQDPAELMAMAELGAAGFKSFMASSSPSFPAVDDADLHTAMLALAALGDLERPYGLHAEHDILLEAGLRRMGEEGRTDPLAHAESRPPLVETAAVNTVLLLAELTGCWVHICHVASADALGLIAAARARGVRVTAETCPQYLALNTDDLERLKGFGRCAPAIRPQDEVDAIWPYVLNETVDLVCSDHCGFTIESKQAGEHDIFEAPNGLAGIQTLLPSFFDGAVVQRGMDPSQFVRQIATNPARIFGLYPRKGTLTVGSDADVLLLDPERAWVARGADMLHRQKWTPFEGKTITGRVIRTLRRGATIYDDTLEGNDRIPAAPGSARFLPFGYGETDE
jgi:allantoinase